MPDRKSRMERREAQTREVEANQAALRASIDETRRLVDESEAMLRRHRSEHDDDDEDDEGEADDKENTASRH